MLSDVFTSFCDVFANVQPVWSAISQNLQHRLSITNAIQYGIRVSTRKKSVIAPCSLTTRKRLESVSRHTEQRDATKQFSRVASFGVNTSTTRRNRTVSLRCVNVVLERHLNFKAIITARAKASVICLYFVVWYLFVLFVAIGDYLHGVQ